MLNEHTVKQVITLLLDVEEAMLTADLPFAEIEGWDSVNALRVLSYLEREAAVQVDFERFMNARVLGELWGATPANPAVSS